LYCSVEEKHFNATLDDIIKAVINRVMIAIETFDKDTQSEEDKKQKAKVRMFKV